MKICLSDNNHDLGGEADEQESEPVGMTRRNTSRGPRSPARTNMDRKGKSSGLKDELPNVKTKPPSEASGIKQSLCQ